MKIMSGLEFAGLAVGAPFDGAARRGSANGVVSVVSVVVGGAAQRSQSYRCGVEFEGGDGLDPRIIVA